MGSPVPVVIVHHNRSERLAATLAALAASTVPVQPIVVDSGSSTAQRTAARRLEPAIVLESVDNIGFGPAANRGFHWALANTDAPWIGLCPHDALVESATIERMLTAVTERPDAGLACADYGDGRSPMFDRHLGPHLVPSSVDEGWEAVDYPHGTFMLARRELLTEVGLFDERYFAYCEETDLGIRARHAGWAVGLVRGARVSNPETNTSTAVVDYLQTRNTIQLVARHGGWWPATFRFTMALWHTLRGPLDDHRGGMFFHRRARIRALLDVLRGVTGAPPGGLYYDKP